MTPEEKAEHYVRDAETSKARILPATGRFHHMHSVLTNENFLIVGSHVDQGTVKKMQRGEYIDFGKLIPKDTVLVQEDQ